MLVQLHAKGPYTVGIFRKSANARLTRELKAKLEEQFDYPLDECSVIVVGAVFKVSERKREHGSEEVEMSSKLAKLHY